nr:acetate--CoA ligase family protein [Luteimonas sp. BDR2-5]
MSPGSLAVVGASPEPGSVGNLVLTNLRRFGYAGALHFVSRTRDELDGQPCHRSIDDLPAGIDAAILAVPQSGVQASVEACIRRGIGGAVVFASGYAELGEAGAEAQALLARTALDAGFALLGPNCMGLLNFAAGAPLTFEAVQPREAGTARRVGIVTQSGAMAGNLRQALLAKGVNVVFAGSSGNEAALTAEDLLGYLIDSDAVDVVALFVEMLRQPAKFLGIAARAREAGKPIVLVHPGRSAKAREAAQSHTGALAGDFEVMRTLAEREAVVVADSLDEAFDTVAILSRYPAPVAGDIAVSSNSGAIRGVAIDVCESLGLPTAALAPSTVSQLAGILPGYATIDNPLDLTTLGMQQPQIFGSTSAALLADPGVGSLVVALMGGSPKQQLDKGQAILPVLARSEKPVALVFMGDESPLGDEFKALLHGSGVPFLRSPDRALRAMARVHQRRDLVEAAALRASPAPVADDLAPLPAGPIAEYRGKQWLRALGIAVPAGGLARSADEAVEIADRIGWPVVIKAQADALTHKSDVGGVAVGLHDEAALRAAWDAMTAQVGAACPDIPLDGILVEAMAARGLELVVGARRDPAWGVVLLVGLGGIWIEVLQDVRLLAADLTGAQIERELRRLKGAALLDGVRGAGAVDVAAVVQVVRRLADLMLARDDVLEVDINPLVVAPAGQGAVALDAVIVGRGGDGAHGTQ